jgi:hypothetical protein
LPYLDVPDHCHWEYGKASICEDVQDTIVHIYRWATGTGLLAAEEPWIGLFALYDDSEEPGKVGDDNDNDQNVVRKTKTSKTVDGIDVKADGELAACDHGQAKDGNCVVKLKSKAS